MLRTLRTALWYTPLRRYLFYRYRYNFSPEQLGFLVHCLNETREIPGGILEIGCAAGQTTCFLNEHLRTAGIRKPYRCIDTFSGFMPEDVEFERTRRSKNGMNFAGFSVNSLKWFRYTLSLNGFDQVQALQADVNDVAFSEPVSFCLLDVDLYRPTAAALNNLWPSISPGGIVIVDDCVANSNFDGALQAYAEFAAKQTLEPEIVFAKLGILRKSRP